jgi:glycosidase
MMNVDDGSFANAPREFHISRRVRDAVGLEASLFGVTGNVVFADFRAARELAHRLDRFLGPERSVSASDLYALGLIDEAMHLVVARHRRDVAPGLWTDALTSLERELGRGSLDQLLRAFVEEFPPRAVYSGEVGAAEYLRGESGGEPHREAVLEELVMLWLANRNPAFAPFRELFDDRSMRALSAYEGATERLEVRLSGTTATGRAGESLLDLLLAPVRAAPDSLRGQLEFIRTSWPDVLGPDLARVLGALDFLAEEHRPVFPPGPGPAEVPDYGVLAEDGERYSADREWMPRLVLLAKNAYVWLAQLSRRHGRQISTLDGVPDEELERLARWGFSGLWLIGIWERSRASERIKRMMGDDEAVASAYSLADYAVAGALGGEPAYENLRDRAWQHGIRLSTDMVPNHVGIDSRWVIEHPDWFLSLRHLPYPTYSFEGPDLSDDERVGIFIEDHYWDRSDAAVVFKRLDRQTGDVRYIYHGNDGTSMPWNDTAQLDYLNPEVREAVIQTILAVARRSPVIRFDAAMTLARQHYHRLWFPAPGAAGAIPSRAEFGMPRAEFDAAMPREFWREVVDRVAEEAPDTLLLAEAFWLLEGYFVRTLGMHRVYNSAFMNMLRDERNAEYRQLIRSTLEFDPQILQRYVNFMSNPDERTAVDQFGTDDKYFGVLTMMVTMPGLPMFGHGQIEGLAEKYGMEFQRPRWDEQPNEGLVRRHELQIFPLLRRRGLFAGSESFLLFDFETDNGSVDENVFAYSNECGGERSLVIYHNRFGETRGSVRTSTAVSRSVGGGDRELVRTSIADSLGLHGRDGWLVARDMVSGREFLWSGRRLRDDGLSCSLEAYQLLCFADVRQVEVDDDHPYHELASRLGDRGVWSVDDALGRLVMAPMLDPVRRVADPELLRRLASGAADAAHDLRARAVEEVPRLAKAAVGRAPGEWDIELLERWILTDIEAVLELGRGIRGTDDIGDDHERGDSILAVAFDDAAVWLLLVGWALVRRLLSPGDGEASSPHDRPDRFEAWSVRAELEELLEMLGRDHRQAQREAALIGLVMAANGWHEDEVDVAAGLSDAVIGVIESPTGSRHLQVNRYGGELWFDREAFEWLVVGLVGSAASAALASGGTAADIEALGESGRKLRDSAAVAGYRVDGLIDLLQGKGNQPTVEG